MKGLREKFRKNSGFTLIEMLIVVAIIAILVAVSIPMIANALDKAKVATDEANERSAMATALIEYMSKNNAEGDYYYKVDGTQGSLVSGNTVPTTGGYGQCKDHAGDYIKINISAEGIVTLTWSGGKDAHLYKTSSGGGSGSGSGG